MSSPNKVNFGSNNGANIDFEYGPKQFSTNNSGYPSGNVQSSYSPVNGYVGTSSIGNDSAGYAYQGGNSTRQSYSDGNLGNIYHVQEGTIQGREYGQVRDINHAPVTKVNFGNKIYTESYAQNTSSTYQAPQALPARRAYQEQVQPVRQQIRTETRYEAPIVEAHRDSHVKASVKKEKNEKKGACPWWIWPLLGLLALLALILGLLFALGVFGGGGGGAAAYNDKMYSVVEEEAVASTDANAGFPVNSGLNTNANLNTNTNPGYVTPVVDETTRYSANTNTNPGQVTPVVDETTRYSANTNTDTNYITPSANQLTPIPFTYPTNNNGVYYGPDGYTVNPTSA